MIKIERRSHWKALKVFLPSLIFGTLAISYISLSGGFFKRSTRNRQGRERITSGEPRPVEDEVILPLIVDDRFKSGIDSIVPSPKLTPLEAYTIMEEIKAKLREKRDRVLGR